MKLWRTELLDGVLQNCPGHAICPRTPILYSLYPALRYSEKGLLSFSELGAIISIQFNSIHFTTQLHNSVMLQKYKGIQSMVQ